MRKFGFALLAAAVLPALVPSDASAQRKFGGAKEADWSAVAGKAPAGPTITRGDLEKISPLKLFLDKKKDLKLNETQLAAVTDADAKLLERNADRYHVVDSLKKLMKPRTSGTPSVEEQTGIILARESMMETLSEIRMSYDVAAKETVAGFDESQQKTAQTLLEKQREDFQKMLMEKVGGGGGGRGGMGPGARGGRPPLE